MAVKVSTCAWVSSTGKPSTSIHECVISPVGLGFVPMFISARMPFERIHHLRARLLARQCAPGMNLLALRNAIARRRHAFNACSSIGALLSPGDPPNVDSIRLMLRNSSIVLINSRRQAAGHRSRRSSGESFESLRRIMGLQVALG